MTLEDHPLDAACGQLCRGESRLPPDQEANGLVADVDRVPGLERAAAIGDALSLKKCPVTGLEVDDYEALIAPHTPRMVTRRPLARQDEVVVVGTAEPRLLVDREPTPVVEQYSGVGLRRFGSRVLGGRACALHVSEPTFGVASARPSMSGELSPSTIFA